MGIDFKKFIPKFCKQTFDSLTVRADAVYFDFTGIKRKSLADSIIFLDIYIQKLQPTTLIFIAEEGVCPIQKTLHKNGKISFKNFSKMDEENVSQCKEFEVELQKKVSSDPAWQKPTVIYSSFRTPGEAEHKIFTFINKFNKDNNISKNQNFINFIVSQDVDCIMLSLANKLLNTYYISGKINEESERKHDDTATFDLFRDVSTFDVINLTLLKEFLYMFMTGYTSAPNNDDLEKVMNDFVLMCMFRENDFLYPNEFDYNSAKKYKILHDQKKYLSNVENINNKNLSEFLDLAKIGLKYSPSDAKKQFDLITWCFLYYHKMTADYLFCVDKGKKVTNGISISEFLKANPTYKKRDFNDFIPNIANRSVFEGASFNIRIDGNIKRLIKTLKIKDDYSNLREIIEEINGCMSKEELDQKRNEMFYIISKDKTVKTSSFDIEIRKERKYFIDSIFNFKDVIAVTEKDIKLVNEKKVCPTDKIWTLKEKDNFTEKRGKGIIGKDIFVGWPIVEPATVGKIIIGDKIIEEDKTINSISDDYILEDVEGYYLDKRQVVVPNEKRIYVYVKPKVVISNSMNIYANRMSYKIYPWTLVFESCPGHPLIKNIEPEQVMSVPEVGDSVYIISKQATGKILSIDDYSATVEYCTLIYPSKEVEPVNGFKYITKNAAAKYLHLNSVKEVNYYFDKAGFKSNFFSCEDNEIPTSVLETMRFVIKSESTFHTMDINDAVKYQIKEPIEGEREVEEFSLSDLLWRRMNLEKYRMQKPINVGSRVVFVGATGVPFGTIGTVCQKNESCRSVFITADKEFTFGIKDKFGKRKLFSALIGDLFAI